jgi:hypothetical protein
MPGHFMLRLRASALPSEWIYLDAFHALSEGRGLMLEAQVLDMLPIMRVPDGGEDDSPEHFLRCMPPATVAEMALRMLYNLRSHYASERSGLQIMAVLGQHMALIAASGGSLGLDRDLALMQLQLEQFRSSGVCRLMNP